MYTRLANRITIYLGKKQMEVIHTTEMKNDNEKKDPTLESEENWTRIEGYHNRLEEIDEIKAALKKLGLEVED